MIKAGFSVRMWAQEILVFITGTGFQCTGYIGTGYIKYKYRYLSTNIIKALLFCAAIY